MADNLNGHFKLQSKQCLSRHMEGMTMVPQQMEATPNMEEFSALFGYNGNSSFHNFMGESYAWGVNGPKNKQTKDPTAAQKEASSSEITVCPSLSHLEGYNGGGPHPSRNVFRGCAASPISGAFLSCSLSLSRSLSQLLLSFMLTTARMHAVTFDDVTVYNFRPHSQHGIVTPLSECCWLGWQRSSRLITTQYQGWPTSPTRVGRRSMLHCKV